MNKHDSLPVRLIIGFVGLIGFFSLFIGAWLYWMGKSGEGVMAITNGCVMGLIGLLGQTRSASNSRQGDEPVPVKTLPGDAVATTEAEGKPAAYAPTETTPEPEQQD